MIRFWVYTQASTGGPLANGTPLMCDWFITRFINQYVFDKPMAMLYTGVPPFGFRAEGPQCG